MKSRLMRNQKRTDLILRFGIIPIVILTICRVTAAQETSSSLSLPQLELPPLSSPVENAEAYPLLNEGSKSEASQDVQNYLDQPLRLNTYKPLYFIMGNPYTKIQLSFETLLVKNQPIYFGYTQLMIWNLFIYSPYFYDLNYNPLAWYRFWIDKGRDQEEWIDFIPWEHESNGVGGNDEISWNRTAALYHRVDKYGPGMKLTTDFKIWYPYQNSANLQQYRGLWELTMTFFGFLGSFFSFDDLSFRIYSGGPSLIDPGAGGQEVTLRLRARTRSLLPLATFQIFHGYGEYLQDYNISHWGIRAGIGF